MMTLSGSCRAATRSTRSAWTSGSAQPELSLVPARRRHAARARLPRKRRRRLLKKRACGSGHGRSLQIPHLGPRQTAGKPFDHAREAMAHAAVDAIAASVVPRRPGVRAARCASPYRKRTTSGSAAKLRASSVVTSSASASSSALRRRPRAARPSGGRPPKAAPQHTYAQRRTSACGSAAGSLGGVRRVGHSSPK